MGLPGLGIGYLTGQVIIAIISIFLGRKVNQDQLEKVRA
jgi:hypothetical protein